MGYLDDAYDEMLAYSIHQIDPFHPGNMEILQEARSMLFKRAEKKAAEREEKKGYQQPGKHPQSNLSVPIPQHYGQIQRGRGRPPNSPSLFPPNSAPPLQHSLMSDNEYQLKQAQRGYEKEQHTYNPSYVNPVDDGDGVIKYSRGYDFLKKLAPLAATGLMVGGGAYMIDKMTNSPRTLEERKKLIAKHHQSNEKAHMLSATGDTIAHMSKLWGLPEQVTHMGNVMKGAGAIKSLSARKDLRQAVRFGGNSPEERGQEQILRLHYDIEGRMAQPYRLRDLGAYDDLTTMRKIISDPKKELDILTGLSAVHEHDPARIRAKTELADFRKRVSSVKYRTSGRRKRSQRSFANVRASFQEGESNLWMAPVEKEIKFRLRENLNHQQTANDYADWFDEMAHKARQSSATGRVIQRNYGHIIDDPRNVMGYVGDMFDLAPLAAALFAALGSIARTFGAPKTDKEKRAMDIIRHAQSWLREPDAYRKEDLDRLAIAVAALKQDPENEMLLYALERLIGGSSRLKRTKAGRPKMY